MTLTGAVDWHFQSSAAEADVRRLRGVIGVSNNIKIKPVAEASDIHTKIAAALARNAAIDSDDIHVTTSGGKVTLRGSVDSWNARPVAENTAWSAPGVTKVEDLLTVN